MNRIVYMVLHHLPIVPYWFWKIDHMGKRPDQYPEQERYDYLRNIIKTINQNGRVTVRGYGEEQLPKENGFILFPNHQGFFDMLAIIDTCPKPLGVIIKKEAANWILVKLICPLSSRQVKYLKVSDKNTYISFWSVGIFMHTISLYIF